MKTARRHGPLSAGTSAIRPSDIVFLFALIAAAAYFLATASYGITVCDETMYQFFPYRIASGDKLFADDWMISNLISVFTYLPYSVYTSLFGGVEGLALSLRYLYVAIKLILFVYIYARLRDYGCWAVLAGVLFIGTDLFGIKTTSYYSVCANAAAIAGILLFIKKDRRKPHLVFAGFLFSCAVIAEPSVALVWFAYSAAVLFRSIRAKKKKTVPEDAASVLSPGVWLYTFIGICAAAAVFLLLCLLVFTGSDLKAMFAGVSEMLQYVTFDNGSGMSTTLIRLMKPVTYCLYYGVYFAVPFTAVWLLCVIPNRFGRRRRKQFFAVLAVLYMLMNVHLILYPTYRNSHDSSGEAVSHPLLLSLLAAASYACTEKKNKKLFAFLVFSFAVSASVDLFSNNSFGSLMLVGCVPAVLLLRDYIAEQAPLFPRRAEGRRKGAAPAKGKAAFGALLCALLVFIPSFEAWHFVYMARLHETERIFCKSDAPLDAVIDTGILKGIRTTAALKENYEKSCRDARAVAAVCENGLIVVDYDTTVYMNAGVRVNTPATHIVGNDWHTEEGWWTLHPDRRPDVAYIPFFTLSYIEFNDITAEEKLAWFEENADITVTEGEIGYIVKIDRWK